MFEKLIRNIATLQMYRIVEAPRGDHSCNGCAFERDTVNCDAAPNNCFTDTGNRDTGMVWKEIV